MQLARSQFFGRFEQRWDVAGFALGRLQATTPEHDVAPHEHGDAHFVLVLDGRYRSAAVDEVLGPGALVWNPAGTRHRDHFESEQGLFLTLSLGARQAAALGLDDGAPRRLQGGAAALAHSLAGLPVDADPDAAALLALETGCHELCAIVAGTPLRPERLPPSWLRRCMERLLDDAVAPPSLAALAAEAGVHPVSLARAFRHHYGLSPGQLQRRAQLNRAAVLLRRGASPAAVAAACGYADQSHFTRAFRVEYRCTPAAWQAGFKTF